VRAKAGPQPGQYRARKQAAVSSVSRLLTRAVLSRHPNRQKNAASLATRRVKESIN